MKESELKKIAKIALATAKKFGATEAEAVLWKGEEQLTRFANNMIHQSVALDDCMVHVRVLLGKRAGVYRTNRLDEPGVKATVKHAVYLSKLQREDPHFGGLPDKATYRKVSHFYDDKVHLGPDGRAKAVGHIISQARKNSLHASGAFSESTGVTAVANSRGVWGFHQGLSASLTTILTGAKGSGFASDSRKGGWDIDYKSVAATALEKATYGEFIDVSAGEYEVILEPPAVAELLDFFAWLGPNARIYHEDVSFYQGNIGKQLFHTSLTIHDDPFHGGGYPTAFDWEGTPKQKVTLVEKGKPKSVVYDSYHANKYKMKNTGHALLAPNTWGPTPTHIVVEPGNADIAAMIKKMKRGILITRFWYTRVVHHKQLILTGMTRDGTFLIEKGKIVGRVRNMRYTQSVIDTLKAIKNVGKELSLVGSEGSPSLVPALHLAKFRFTGVTEHG